MAASYLKLLVLLSAAAVLISMSEAKPAPSDESDEVETKSDGFISKLGGWYDKAKEGVKEGYEKTKDTVNEGIYKIKKAYDDHKREREEKEALEKVKEAINLE